MTEWTLGIKDRSIFHHGLLINNVLYFEMERPCEDITTSFDGQQKTRPANHVLLTMMVRIPLEDLTTEAQVPQCDVRHVDSTIDALMGRIMELEEQLGEGRRALHG